MTIACSIPCPSYPEDIRLRELWVVVAGVSCSHRQLPGQGPFVVACRAWTPHYRILVALVEKVLDCAGCAITCSFDWFDCHLHW